MRQYLLYVDPVRLMAGTIKISYFLDIFDKSRCFDVSDLWSYLSYNQGMTILNPSASKYQYVLTIGI